MNIPQELIDLYAALIKGADDVTAGQHLQSFLEDAKAIAAAVQAVIDSAKAKNGQ